MGEGLGKGLNGGGVGGGGSGTICGGGGVVGVRSGLEKSLVKSSGIDSRAFLLIFLPSSVPKSKAPAMPTVRPAMKAENELSRIGLGWSDGVIVGNV